MVIDGSCNKCLPARFEVVKVAGKLVLSLSFPISLRTPPLLRRLKKESCATGGEKVLSKPLAAIRRIRTPTILAGRPDTPVLAHTCNRVAVCLAPFLFRDLNVAALMAKLVLAHDLEKDVKDE